MSKAHILFIDLEMHKETGSANFFVELLRQKYDVEVCYVSSRRDARMPTKQAVQKYDAIVYWQVTPSNRRARSFGKPTIYVPMYDGETFNIFNWMQRRICGARAICFCEKEADFLERAGFAPLRVKYYPPIRKAMNGDPRKLFYWDRDGFASFLTIKELFAPNVLKSIMVRCPDFRRHLISKSDIEEYKITYVPFGMGITQEEYFAMFSECGLFSTSRPNEGIGMGFLEAMAMGKCVIVNDEPTFNEYVKDGVTGLLVNFKNPSLSKNKIVSANIPQIQKNAYQQVVQGRKEWETKYQQLILEFVDETIRTYCCMTVVDIIKWKCYVPIKFLLDIRTYCKRRWNSIKYRYFLKLNEEVRN